MTIRMGFDSSAQRALEAWRIVTHGLLDMADHLPRGQIFFRQAHACYLCTQTFVRGALQFHGAHHEAPSRDHVFPRGRGGRAQANILLAHKGCNCRKGDRWPYPCEVIYLAAIYAAPGVPIRHKARRR